MFVRRKPNKSGLVSIQVIDKTSGRYRVVKTIGSSKDTKELERLEQEAKQFVQEYTGIQVLDFTDHKKIFSEVLSSIISHKLVGIQYVLGKIFDDIGFNQIQENLFRYCFKKCVKPKNCDFSIAKFKLIKNGLYTRTNFSNFRWNSKF